MTLHEAIEQILLYEKEPLTYAEIALRVNSQRLYHKNDGSNVTANQIAARVKKYQDLFNIGLSGVALQDVGLRPFRDLSKKIYLLNQFSGLDSETSMQLNAIVLFYAYHVLESLPRVTSNFKGQLVQQFRRLEHSIKNRLDNFINITYKIEDRLREREAEEIYLSLSEFSYTKLSAKEFGEFFNDSVNEYTIKDRFRGSSHSSPKVLSYLMSTLFRINEGARLFDPFAGNAGLAHELLKRSSDLDLILGDINESAGIIGTLNILNSNNSKPFTYKIANAFEKWHHNVKADFFISAPPINMKIADYNFESWQIFHSFDYAINAVLLALYHTKTNGKIVLLVPESILFSRKKDAYALREYLIQRNYLAGVILLPKDTLRPQSTASMALIAIDKSRSEINNDLFICDCSNIRMENFRQESEKIAAAFTDKSLFVDGCKWISTTELDNGSYEINIRQQLIDNYNGPEYSSLGTLATIRSGKYVSVDNLNEVEGIPFIQIKNLNGDHGIYSLKVSDVSDFISDTELISGKIEWIAPSSILISKVGENLKPTLFEGAWQALISSNIIGLVTNELIHPEYLITQLQSEYVELQFKAIRRYSGIPTFNLDELKKVRIRMLPIDEQLQYVASFYSKKIQIVERDAVKTGDDALYNLISRIKHEVNQPISSLGIDLKLLMSYLIEKSASNGPVSIKDYAVEPLEGQSESDTDLVRISNILNRMNNCVADAQHTLKKAEETLNLRSDTIKFEEIDLKQLLENTFVPLYANANCVFRIKGSSSIIKADSYQLKILFKNLFDNALKHGFTENRSKNENIISIQFGKLIRQNMLEVTVMNNGKAFPKGFNKNTFETKGSTASKDHGSGFGGYHIKRIIENHNGEFKITPIDELLHSDFKVQFNIYLPLSN